MRVLMMLLLLTSVLEGQSKIDLEKATTLYYDAKDLYYDGDYNGADQKFDACIAIREKYLSSPHELLYKAYMRKGNTSRKLRNLISSEKYLFKALDQAKELYGDESNEVAGMYMDIGTLESKKHLYTKSMEWNRKCIDIRSKIYGTESINVAYARMNNANNLYSIGNFVKCINEYKKILSIYDKELRPDHENYNRVYLTLSNAYRKKGDLDNSLLYAEKALEIKLLNYREDHPSVSKYYSNLAKVQASLNQLKKAKKNFDQSIKIEKKSGSEEALLSTMNDAARVLLKSGDFENAKKIFENTLTIRTKNSRKYLIAKSNLAIAYYNEGDVKNGYKLLSEVLTLAPESEGYLDLCDMSRKLGLKEEGVKYLALAKEYAREGDLLTNVKILVEQAKQQASTDKNEAWQSINLAIEELTVMRRRYLGSSSKNYINEELENIFDFAVELSIDRYNEAPRNEHLIDIYETIEMAKAASFWDNLSEENAAFYGKVPDELLEEIEILKDAGNKELATLEEKLKELERDFPEYYKVKYTLSVPEINSIQGALDPEMVIFDYYVLDDRIVALKIGKSEISLIRSKNNSHIDFANEWDSIEGSNVSRVCIIPHRFIHYESFEKIINPSSGRYFLYDFAFSYQVNVQGFIANEKSSTSENYLAFVPDFEQPRSSKVEVLRSSLVSLPGAMREVNEASKLFDGQVFKGEYAAENKFYELASDYNYIHFATHAQIDPQNELNSYLFLTEGENEEDGILYADEIMKTDINAEMVILSACETGNGGLRSGEGVMSLSRAFQYAGAKSVLMSLWRANDQSAQPIIVNFLKNYKKGMPKDVALQASKIRYLETADPLMRDEFYWAGFMINGDLSPLARGKQWISYLLVMLVVFSVVFLMFRLMKGGLI